MQLARILQFVRAVEGRETPGLRAFRLFQHSEKDQWLSLHLEVERSFLEELKNLGAPVPPVETSPPPSPGGPTLPDSPSPQ